MAIWIVAGLLLGCLLLLFLPRRTVHWRGLALLRCFFPSWRFFEEIEPGPKLRVSSALPGAEFGPFRDAWAPAPRTFAALVVNARGNLELAYQSIVDQLWSELAEDPETPEALVSYRLIQNLIQIECLAAEERAPGARYRFQLASADPDFESFESAPHEAAL